MTKQRKQTAEDLLLQKTGTKESWAAKEQNALAEMERYRGYAERYRQEKERRERQIEAMKERIEAGKEARREADQLRGAIPVMQKEGRSGTDEYKEVLAKVIDLDKFYHDTDGAVAKINNGSVM